MEKLDGEIVDWLILFSMPKRSKNGSLPLRQARDE
jgi:hypothetical protein